MLLKYFYDKELAHASYMVGCQRTNEALIIDPARHIQSYLETAEQEGMRIVAAADTHIHADYVSGARELAERVGAKLYVSDEGGEEWQYEYASQYEHQKIVAGDKFMLGNVQLAVLHTPGHTPESVSYVLTDLGGGANRPMGIFTGDFVFVGSLGRPDLLEEAVGEVGAAQAGARAMFNSVKRFKQLPDYLQVWPAHGAGSSCGKGLGAVPSSTVGYEKLFNPMLGYEREEAFVAALLDGQPEAPKYYAQMKQVNRKGPKVLGEVAMPEQLSAENLPDLLAKNAFVIDTNNHNHFAAGHVPGTINITMGNLATWTGWFVNYAKPVYLIVAANELARAVRILHEIGVDEIAGYFVADEVVAAGLNTESYRIMPAAELADPILQGEVTLIDVRAQTEWDEGHLPHAEHIMLGYLRERADEVVNVKPIVVQCRSGNRSALAASILQAAGAKQVINMAGGYRDWRQAGLPVEK